MGKNVKYEAVRNEADTVEFEPFQRKLLTSTRFWSILMTCILIGIYYVPSICLTFYQRWLYQSFHFPLITVLVHMIVKYILASLIRVIITKKKGSKRILLNWKDYLIAVAPIGIFSGFDICFSNWGLEFIKISLYTMTKSTTIVFILFFSILFKLERKSWSLSGIVTMIAFGLFLFTYETTEFNFFGFMLLLIASMSSGVRWTCVQLLLQKSKMGMKNPVDMIYHMQPWMIISVLPFAVWFEGSLLIRNCQLFRFTEYSVFLHITFKILLGAFIAFFMEFAEVMVVAYTSSLTLAIAGIVKEVFILVLAVVWSGDQMSGINFIGLLICLSGIIFHVIHKFRTIETTKPVERFYDHDNERHELGEYLIDGDVRFDSDSEGEKSDSQVLFDILNKHEK